MSKSMTWEDVKINVDDSLKVNINIEKHNFFNVKFLHFQHDSESRELAFSVHYKKTPIGTVSSYHNQQNWEFDCFEGGFQESGCENLKFAILALITSHLEAKEIISIPEF